MLPTSLLPDSHHLSYIAQAYLPRDGTVHSGLGSPALIINRENTPKTHPQANMMEDILQLRFPLPKD